VTARGTFEARVKFQRWDVAISSGDAKAIDQVQQRLCHALLRLGWLGRVRASAASFTAARISCAIDSLGWRLPSSISSSSVWIKPGSIISERIARHLSHPWTAGPSISSTRRAAVATDSPRPAGWRGPPCQAFSRLGIALLARRVLLLKILKQLKHV
jgi:hypothetical protein